MKSSIFACAVAALAMGAALLSFAQDQDRGRRDPDQSGYQQRDSGQGDAPQRAARHGHARHDVDRGSEDQRRGDDSRMGDSGEAGRQDEFHYGARGPEWRRGAHVPPLYRSRQYVVNDWRAHHLSPPPRGYQWVQVGTDYVLVAVATGIIAQLVLANP